MPASEDCSAHGAMEQLGSGWAERLPGTADTLMAWCLDAGQDELLELLAYLVALTLDAVQTRHDAASAPLSHADALASTLALDMRRHWQGSVEGFYARLSKPALAQIVVESGAVIGVAISELKRADAARTVAEAVAPTGWLPVPLRPRAEAAPAD